MSVKLRSISVTTLLILAASPDRLMTRSVRADEASAWRQRFLDEAPKAWERYRARVEKLQGTVRFKGEEQKPVKGLVRERWFEIKHRPGCLLLLHQDLLKDSEPKTTGRVSVVNPRYGFELRRSSPTSPWVAIGVDTDPSDGFSLKDPPNEDLELWLTCPFTYTLIFDPLRVVVGEPGFTLKDATPVKRGDTTWIKVGIEYRAPSDKPRLPSLKGWVVYDPDHDWVIREFDMNLKWWQLDETMVAASTATFDYDVLSDGFAVIKKVAETLNYPKKSFVESWRIDFNLKEADVPSGEFTMTAFGLPEPAGPRRPIPWFAIALGAGIVCLLLAFYLRHRSAHGSSTA
ncbi:MAG TPA: hypothetical protein VG406_22070 [Isosphaeraceae bacterium]|nr:hypothetical protein [Isosphaeraceae bacterium]